MKLTKNDLKKYTNLHRDIKEISLSPIQRGGILTDEARRALISFGDGYSTCDYCLKGRLDLIERPPIKHFTEQLAEFLGMDQARVVTRCREAKFIIFHSLAKENPGGTVVVDSLAHYSTYLAAELAGLKIKEVPHLGYPEFKLDIEQYVAKIDEAEDETGDLPIAVLLTHVDYLYGNWNDPKPISKKAHDRGIPFILNAAYTAGVASVNGKELGVDFITGSGHKSWASAAPTGILATTDEYAEIVFRRSKIQGGWSKRKFPIKEVELLGCTVMGAPMITLMASFPTVVERVKRWDEEIEKVRYLIQELEKIEDTKQLGIKPKEHTLTHMETLGFYELSKTHKKRGYFLYKELKKKNISGLQPGLSEHWKINTYGLDWNKIETVANAFKDIASKYGISVED